MKRKNFHDYLKKRLTAEEIAEIERQAQREVDIFKALQAARASTKEVKSTFDKFIESLSPEERKQYDAEYREFILSELILATEANHKTEPVIFASDSKTSENN